MNIDSRLYTSQILNTLICVCLLLNLESILWSKFPGCMSISNGLGLPLVSIYLIHWFPTDYNLLCSQHLTLKNYFRVSCKNSGQNSSFHRTPALKNSSLSTSHTCSKFTVNRPPPLLIMHCSAREFRTEYSFCDASLSSEMNALNILIAR